ncbi:MAG TPA: NUDIX domain-containing protein [Spirochaetia bacterium]|nr:NUDIX domain-containing protein [Spirochaetia bacterium]
MTPISVSGIAHRSGSYFVALRKPGTSIGECWEFPGGKCEEGEDPPDALKREFLEEFDLPVSVGREIHRGSFSNGKQTYRQIAYEVEFLIERYTLHEHQKAFWATLEELEKLSMADSDRLILETLRSLCLEGESRSSV